MKMNGGNSLAMKSNQNSRQSFAMGDTQITSLPFLVPQNKRSKVKVLAVGNAVPSPKSLENKNLYNSSENKESMNPIQAIQYFVASSNGDIVELLSCVLQLKQANPCLKIVLADSTENPRFVEAPPGVELIVPVTREQSFAATGLVANKSGFLCGPSGGMAVCSSALIANNIQDQSIIMTAVTNLNKQLLSHLNI